MVRKQIFLIPMVLAALVALLGGAIVGAQDAGQGPVATARFQQTGIEWQPNVSTDFLVLTVSTPGGEVLRGEFPPGSTPNFQAVDDAGNPRPDGHYTYELRVIPSLDQESIEALTLARQTEEFAAVLEQLRREGKLPEESIVQSGNFSILGGYIVLGSFEQESSDASVQPSANLVEAEQLDSGQVATASVRPMGIDWQPIVNFDRLVLTISMPGGSVLRDEFAAGSAPYFRVVDQNGNLRPDGQYVYELRVIPLLDQ